MCGVSLSLVEIVYCLSINIDPITDKHTPYHMIDIPPLWNLADESPKRLLMTAASILRQPNHNSNAPQTETTIRRLAGTLKAIWFADHYNV